MTSSSKLTWGIILLITGWVLFLVGILISFTLVGACLGSNRSQPWSTEVGKIN
jgi:hypothetical protein